MAQKTLEEYRIQEIATGVFNALATDFVRRGEYDLHVSEKNTSIKELSKQITALQKAEEERQKDKKTLKFQLSGVAIAFLFQFAMAAIVALNGFRIGGN